MISAIRLELNGNINLGEALPSTASSAAIFANAPAGTKVALLTLRGGALSVRLDGSAATTTAGHELGEGVHEFTLGDGALKRVRAINSSAGGPTSGWITYLG